MKISNLIYCLICILFFFFIYSCNSNKIDAKKIRGKWITVNDVKNSQITLTIADSTMISEFNWNNGIKKVFFNYKIISQKRDHLIIETMNVFKLLRVDTFSFEKTYLKINSGSGKTLVFQKLQ